MTYLIYKIYITHFSKIWYNIDKGLGLMLKFIYILYKTFYPFKMPITRLGRTGDLSSFLSFFISLSFLLRRICSCSFKDRFFVSEILPSTAIYTSKCS